MECNARRAYAAAKNLHLDAVTIKEVQNSAEGEEGWAATTVSVAVSSSRSSPSNPKPKPKAKQKSVTDGGVKTLAQHEKELKGLVSLGMTLNEEITIFKETLNRAEGDKQWAEGYLKKMNDLNAAMIAFRKSSVPLRNHVFRQRR